MCQWFESTSKRAKGALQVAGSEPDFKIQVKEGLGADLIKAVDYSDWFSRPCAQKGWASSVRVFIDRVVRLRGVRRGVAQSGQRICFGYRGP